MVELRKGGSGNVREQKKKNTKYIYAVFMRTQEKVMLTTVL